MAINIQATARAQIHAELIAQLKNEAAQKRAIDAAFDAAIENAAQVRLETHVFDLLSNGLSGLSNHTVQASAESIDELVQHSSRMLSGDDAIGQAYWKQESDEALALRAKLEFSILALNPDVRRNLNNWAASRFDILYAENKAAIFALPTLKRREIERLAGGQDAPLETVFEFQETIEVEKGAIALSDHIFCDVEQNFHPSPVLNGWESRALEEELAEERFLGWFRNPGSGEGSVIVPYKDANGAWHGKAPDLVVFSEGSDGKIRCAMVEPHDIERDNSWCIARGFAEFAEKFDSTFERIELTCERKGVIKKLDLCKPSVRKSGIR